MQRQFFNSDVPTQISNIFLKLFPSSLALSSLFSSSFLHRSSAFHPAGYKKNRIVCSPKFTEMNRKDPLFHSFTGVTIEKNEGNFRAPPPRDPHPPRLRSRIIDIRFLRVVSLHPLSLAPVSSFRVSSTFRPDVLAQRKFGLSRFVEDLEAAGSQPEWHLEAIEDRPRYLEPVNLGEAANLWVWPRRRDVVTVTEEQWR